jgi:hypothetical protein
MIDKLTAGMKSWIKQDYQDICESPAEYSIADLANEFGKIVDIIEEDVILDDCDEMLRDQWPHLVLVNDEEGLTEADVEKAVGILNQTQDK